MPEDAIPYDPGATAERPRRRRANPVARPTQLLPLTTVAASRLLATEPPPRRWIVEDMVPAGAVTLLSGDGGTGKSLLAMQMAVSVVTGRPFFGRAVEQGPVLYVSCEDDLDELHRRLDWMARTLEVPADQLDGLEFHDRVGADSALMIWPDWNGAGEPTGLLSTVQDAAITMGARAVIFDSLHNFFTGNENNRPQVQQFTAAARAIGMETQGAVMFIMHPSVTGLAEGSGRGGSTGWRNAARAMWLFARPNGTKNSDDGPADPDLRHLTNMKVNSAREGARIALRWHEGTFQLADDQPSGNVVDAIARKGREDKADAAFLAALRAADDAGMVVTHNPNASNFAPRMLARLAEARPFKQADLLAAMYRLMGTAIRYEETRHMYPNRARRLGLVIVEGKAEDSDLL